MGCKKLMQKYFRQKIINIWNQIIKLTESACRQSNQLNKDIWKRREIREAEEIKGRVEINQSMLVKSDDFFSPLIYLYCVFLSHNPKYYTIQHFIFVSGNIQELYKYICQSKWFKEDQCFSWLTQHVSGFPQKSRSYICDYIFWATKNNKSGYLTSFSVATGNNTQ